MLILTPYFYGLNVAFASESDQPVSVELIAEHASIQPGGRTRVGIHFNIKKGWHIYANPPGDAGLATSVLWSGACAVFGSNKWPEAKEFVDAGDIHTRGYDSAFTVSALTTNACDYNSSGKWEGINMDVRAEVRWLACRELCVPGKANLSLTLPVRPASSVLSDNARLFEPMNDSTDF